MAEKTLAEQAEEVVSFLTEVLNATDMNAVHDLLVNHGEDVEHAAVMVAGAVKDAGTETEDRDAAAGMHVLVHGDLGNGFEVLGPFKTGDAAVEWGDQNIRGEYWEVFSLREPE